VQAAVRLALRDDPAAFAAAVEGRVGALARAQVLLADTGWRGAELRAVAEAALAPFLPHVVGGAMPEGGDDGAAPPRAELAGPAVRLAAAATQPLSLALHELATNAAKYGALSAGGGRVALAWEVTDGALRLRWRETGGPPVAAPPARRGFGTRVLEATLRDQLGGRIERRWETGGLVCDLEVPLARVLPQAEPEPPAVAAAQ
jgi:two-component sensor histidine kinase